MADVVNGYFLDAVTAAGESEAADTFAYKHISVFFTTEDVGDGATIDIETVAPNGTWHVVSRQIINDAGPVSPLLLEGAFWRLRANISTYVDGTYTVMFVGKT